MLIKNLSLALLTASLSLTACVTQDAPFDSDGPGGKADDASSRVTAAINRLTADGVLDENDAAEIFDAAGGNVSEGEMLLIRDALESTRYEVTDGARETSLELARLANLFDVEQELVSDPTAPSYGGSEIPPAVTALIAKARLNGANAYDVRETNGAGDELRWTHYLPTAPNTASTSLEYTEVTPTKLQEDIDAVDLSYNVYARTENGVAVYTTRTGGTGSVLSHYDEAFHPDIYSRGSSGQKWANNCAILSDGSLHCLPASRRDENNSAILTNPDLSSCADQEIGEETSCRHLLYHGHIDIRAGVVVGVEVSGVPSQRVASGKDILVDPIAVLEAWGYETAPGLRIRWGNTSEGTPVRNLERGIIEAPAAP